MIHVLYVLGYHTYIQTLTFQNCTVMKGAQTSECGLSSSKRSSDAPYRRVTLSVVIQLYSTKKKTMSIIEKWIPRLDFSGR